MRIDEERAFGAALRNAEEFFMGEARVQKALEEVTAAFSPCQPEGWHFGDLGHPKLPVLWFDRLHIPFAVAGAMALNAYGYERVTTDVDLLVTREGLASFKAACLGRGYSEKLPGSKGVRDTVHGVDIDFLLAGEYPGDGKQKPVAFPDPATVATTGKHRFLPLTTLVELKLASGMTAPHRLKDLADVLELVRARGLPASFADTLHPYVREKFVELQRAAEGAKGEE